MASCKRCGECCRYVGVQLQEFPSKDVYRLMKLRGIIVEERVTPNGSIYTMMVPCKCSQLITVSKNHASCALITSEDRRPDQCKKEPTVPWHHPNACRFYDDDDQGKLVG